MVNERVNPRMNNELNNSDEYMESRRSVAQSLESGDIDAIWSVLPLHLSQRRHEDISHVPAEVQYEKITSRSLEILPAEELKRKLTSSKQTGIPLEIKYGIDPTGSEIHLGHAVPIILLNRMQRMGHNVTFVVGDFTARIGDPSGRVASRPVLTKEQIHKNMETYVDQIAPILDVNSLTVKYNGEWLDNYSLGELIGVLAHIPASQALQRDDFRQRIGSGLTMAETLYSVVMALDSVHLNSDIELGGKDQLLNMQMCRTVMGVYGQNPEVIISTDIMQGIDGSGKKMGKSLNNYVALQHTAEEVFGKVMSIPDSLMGQYYSMLTELEDNEWNALLELMKSQRVNPMEVKKILAYDLVNLLHGEQAAKEAKAAFELKFSKKDYDDVDGLPEIIIGNGDTVESIKDILSEVRNKAVGNSELRRLVSQSGVRLISSSGEQFIVGEVDQLRYIPSDKSFIKIGKIVIKLVH